MVSEIFCDGKTPLLSEVGWRDLKENGEKLLELKTNKIHVRSYM